MARKKGGHAGGHGWFVTFADLMALLMSFFVMLTAFSSQDKAKMQTVAGSMREAFGTQRVTRNAGVVELDGIPTRPNLKNVEISAPENGSDITSPVRLQKRDEGIRATLYDQRFATAAASLRMALQELPEVAELSKHVSIEETRNGLDISISDQDGRSMFPDGGKLPFERTRQLLEKLAPALRKMPNRLRVTGHTSASRGAARPGSGGWELSTERALAVRAVLAESGVPDDRFAEVVGRADTDPLFPDDPLMAANRRVSILLLREAPPLPASARP